MSGNQKQNNVMLWQKVF